LGGGALGGRLARAGPCPSHLPPWSARRDRPMTVRRANPGRCLRYYGPSGLKLFCLSVLLVLAGCGRPAPQAPPPKAGQGASIRGLGEIMALQQMRHAKLWLAGSAGNWPLAAYELDELREGFDDVVHFHPTHKDAPLPLDQLVPKIVGQPLQ